MLRELTVASGLLAAALVAADLGPATPSRNVPGHWELPVGDGRAQVPPAAVERPDAGGSVTTLPGGVRTLPASAVQPP